MNAESEFSVAGLPERTPSPRPAGAQAGRSLPWIALVLVAACAFLAGLTELRDYDMFHHLAVGRDFLRRRGFPSEDPFLFPLQGERATPLPYWLGSVVIFLSERALGDAGPVYLAGLLGALLFVVLFLDSVSPSRQDLTLVELLVAAGPLALALALFRERAVARTELFANVLLATTLFALGRHERGKSRLILAFPLLAVAWMNLHPSLLAGIAVLAIAVAVGLAQLGAARVVPRLVREKPPVRRIAVAAAVAGAGVLAAGLLNPNLFDPFRTAWRFALASAHLGGGIAIAPVGAGTSSFVKQFVTEMQPLPLDGWLGPFGLLVALTALSFAGGRRVSVREAITVALFAALAAQTRRFTTLAAIVAAPVAARNLVGGVARLRGRFGDPAARIAGVPAALLLAYGAFSVASVPGIRFGVGLRADAFPVRAVDYLAARGPGRVYNTFHYGGYLEWRLDRPVFQDGRAIYREGEGQFAAEDLGHYPRFAALDRRYRFDAIVIAYPPLTPEIAEMLAGTGGADHDWIAPRDLWSLVAFDDGGLLYLRRDGRYAAQAAADEYRFVLPGNPLTRARLANHDFARGLAADLERCLAESPGSRRCREQLAEVRPIVERIAQTFATGARLYAIAQQHASAGRLDEAIAACQASLAAVERSAPAHATLGYFYLDKGDASRALVEQRRALAIDPGLAEAHYGLGLALVATDPRGAAEAFRTYLRLVPNGPWSEKARGELRSAAAHLVDERHRPSQSHEGVRRGR